LGQGKVCSYVVCGVGGGLKVQRWECLVKRCYD
jgi:hypothetical protein